MHWSLCPLGRLHGYYFPGPSIASGLQGQQCLEIGACVKSTGSVFKRALAASWGVDAEGHTAYAWQIASHNQ